MYVHRHFVVGFRGGAQLAGQALWYVASLIIEVEAPVSSSISKLILPTSTVMVMGALLLLCPPFIGNNLYTGSVLSSLSSVTWSVDCVCSRFERGYFPCCFFLLLHTFTKCFLLWQ